MPQPQNIIAIVYDYDRTLSPRSMQDDVLFKRLGLEGKEFWDKTNKLKADRLYDDEMAWIRLLLETPEFRRLGNSDLELMGQDLRFYPGVPDVFGELGGFLANDEYRRHGIVLEHYIVTSGLKSILAGSLLNQQVARIFGCELDEDSKGTIFWPKRVISHTGKTQYLFRITKGLEYMDFSRDVNDHMPDNERRIPFYNMLYIGDGPTDVPSFAVVSSRGGKALAVYDGKSQNSFETCMSLREAERVDEIADADYRKGTHLRKLMEHYVKQMAIRIVADQESEHSKKVIQAPRHG